MTENGEKESELAKPFIPNGEEVNINRDICSKYKVKSHSIHFVLISDSRCM